MMERGGVNKNPHRVLFLLGFFSLLFFARPLFATTLFATSDERWKSPPYRSLVEKIQIEGKLTSGIIQGVEDLVLREMPFTFLRDQYSSLHSPLRYFSTQYGPRKLASSLKGFTQRLDRLEVENFIQHTVHLVSTTQSPGTLSLWHSAQDGLKRYFGSVINRLGYLTTLINLDVPPVPTAAEAGHEVFRYAALQSAADYLSFPFIDLPVTDTTRRQFSKPSELEPMAERADGVVEYLVYPGAASVEVGHAGTQGFRDTMDDAVDAQWFEGEKNPLKGLGIRKLGIIGLYDGHGPSGAKISQLAAGQVPKTIIQFLLQLSPQTIQETDSVIKVLQSSFSSQGSDGVTLKTVDDELLSSFNPLKDVLGQLNAGDVYFQGGTTALVAVFLDERIYLINLGDSRAVLVPVMGPAQRLTRDHRSREPIEKRIIEERGGWVPQEGELMDRLNGVLMPSRVLGDWWNLEGGILPVYRRPEVSVVDQSDRKALALVLVCDGVTDVLTDNQIAKEIQSSLVGRHFSAKETAAKIAQKALACKSDDNITSVVVRFR